TAGRPFPVVVVPRVLVEKDVGVARSEHGVAELVGDERLRSVPDVGFADSTPEGERGLAAAPDVEGGERGQHFALSGESGAGDENDGEGEYRETGSGHVFPPLQAARLRS